MSLVPVPAEQQPTTCANCGAELAADQRYCLECGRPASPVRLAFLDVLESERPRTNAAAPQALELAAAGYAPVYAAPGMQGWLRRNTGLLALLGVLLLCVIAGLLVGHWASQGRQTAGPSTVKIEGLGGLGAAGAITTPAGGTTTSGGSSVTHKEAAEAAKETAKETKAEKAPPPAPKKVSSTKLQKLSSSSGKKHHEEIEALGAEPIETTGG
ncbi:MAG TPA: zinc ribbon domain-containing protein [Solirubrobacteraceae bacterium]|nr:zinc ribbon domain-containing protein [Solirubrobacteraceae bacterium]